MSFILLMNVAIIIIIVITNLKTLFLKIQTYMMNINVEPSTQNSIKIRPFPGPYIADFE